MAKQQKFAFEHKPKPRRYVMTLYMSVEMHTRIIKACETHGAGPQKSQQELVRQMINHCLRDLGV